MAIYTDGFFTADVTACDRGFITDDPISPNHYETKSMRCRDIIKVMVEGLTPMEAVDMANIVKYLYRFKHKDGMKDLKKVAEYAKFLIEDTEVK